MAHCVHPSGDEVRLLRETRTAAVHCASSNFLLGSGIMDVRRFLDEGVTVGESSRPYTLQCMVYGLWCMVSDCVITS